MLMNEKAHQVCTADPMNSGCLKRDFLWCVARVGPIGVEHNHRSHMADQAERQGNRPRLRQTVLIPGLVHFAELKSVYAASK